MLEELRIRGLGVIEDAHLTFGQGLTVVTGETGAGKTMVLTGLGLLLGARSDAALVRSDVDRAVVEGRLRLDPASPAVSRVVDAGGAIDDEGGVLLGRTISSEGRSRAVAGGTTVPVAVLAEIGAEAVAVHGQSEQLHLRRSSTQRDVLDRSAGIAHLQRLSDYSGRWLRLREVDAELESIATESEQRRAIRDRLTRAVTEIGEAAPESGEDHRLDAESARLSHVDALRTAVEDSKNLLDSSESPATSRAAVEAVVVAQKLLDHAAELDPTLSELAARLRETAIVLGDVVVELAQYGQGLDADPARLAMVEERRALLRRLVRAHLPDEPEADVDRLVEWTAEATVHIAALDDDVRATQLRDERTVLHDELIATAALVTKTRLKAASQLSAAATDEIRALAMPKASFVIKVTPHGELGPHGADDVEFTVAANPGVAPAPVHKAASGGELSRIMLALEVVLAGSQPVRTFVFDEVDAGVGGRAAVEVGLRLARLARTAQVVVVTHLPQVAAFADHHLVVEKDHEASVTSAGVRLVESGERVDELARMLAGLDGSAVGRAHAEELLATAASLVLASPTPAAG